MLGNSAVAMRTWAYPACQVSDEAGIHQPRWLRVGGKIKWGKILINFGGNLQVQVSDGQSVGVSDADQSVEVTQAKVLVRPDGKMALQLRNGKTVLAEPYMKRAVARELGEALTRV